jgi:hypothetical protein
MARDDEAAPRPRRVEALAARLAEPVGAVTFAELAGLWRHVTITADADLPTDFDDGPGLPARVRGALGWALVDRRATGADARHGRPAAHDVLFGAHGTWAPGLTVPKPYVLACRVAGVRLSVGITLFGFAVAWAGEVTAALLAALDRGIALGPGLRVRASIRPDSVAVSRREGVAVPPLLADPALRGLPTASLVFRTPAEVRRGDGLLTDGPALMGSLANRISGLARWQDLRVVDDFAGLARVWAAASYGTDRLRPAGWSRHTSTRPGVPIDMRGVIGPLDVSGPVDRLMPLLAIGETCHLGSQAALGLGRYDLARATAA